MTVYWSRVIYDEDGNSYLLMPREMWEDCTNPSRVFISGLDTEPIEWTAHKPKKTHLEACPDLDEDLE